MNKKTTEEISDRGKALTEMRMTLGHLCLLEAANIEGKVNDLKMNSIIHDYAETIKRECLKYLEQ